MKDNLKNGLGLHLFPNGELYQGYYENDDRQGLHIVIYQSTSST
jgi:hypothetical protein